MGPASSSYPPKSGSAFSQRSPPILLLGVNSALTWYVGRQDAMIQPVVDERRTAQSSADLANSRQVPAPADFARRITVAGRLQLRHRVSDILQSVLVGFANALSESQSLMAEPRARWTPDCVGEPGLPPRRLTTVALCGTLCLVFYELGGFVKQTTYLRSTSPPTAPSQYGMPIAAPASKDPAILMAAIKAEKILAGDKSFSPVW